ncbi:hypothetical protein LJB89_03090 [Tyzzerella sp. OttesenSCG-928-J15]|nr:hypothetical protein [Tyzzerella sp. OttesenSCG-928-J15]
MLGIKFTLSDDIIKKVVGNVNLPLLMFDQHWLALFPKEYKNARMKDSEAKIVELMKEEARINEKVRNLSAKKAAAIERINSLTTEAYIYGKKSAKVEIQRCKAIIIRANSFFVMAERRIKAIDKQMQDTNRAILEETIKVCYTIMKESKEKIEVLDPKIAAMREEMKKMIAEMAKHEQEYEMTYRLLNRLVGNEIINKLDREEAAGRKKWFWA